MSPRTHTASWAALLLALALSGCAPLQEGLHRLADDAALNPIQGYDRVDPDAPFAGSPAEDYGEGFDTPEAEPVGSFSEEQVAHAYATTRDFLEAVYLDEDAVFDEDNSEFNALLSGRALEWYLDDLGHEDPERDTRRLPFNLTPGTAEPVGDAVRVDGWMRAEEARDGWGAYYLAVRTEYTVVHPVARPGDAVSVRLVTSHRGEVGFHDTGDGALEAWPRWWRFVAPAHCLEQHTFTPAFPDEFTGGERPGGAPLDPYDLEETGGARECGAVQDT
ncbi:hypothetical protein [Nocardiopsis alborubida]|uniref:Lipoprotein n=1 Tax=Nocardiopsis alborubida TaxID=146802 RepID=A0A7X6MIG4_9ACTN|nr:hypothetical protein [Nocardiopsis alborubida]NKZ00364.1 hypothetical protein [Nocardiopsis alborubida]